MTKYIMNYEAFWNDEVYNSFDMNQNLPRQKS